MTHCSFFVLLLIIVHLFWFVNLKNVQIKNPKHWPLPSPKGPFQKTTKVGHPLLEGVFKKSANVGCSSPKGPFRKSENVGHLSLKGVVKKSANIGHPSPKRPFKKFEDVSSPSSNGPLKNPQMSTAQLQVGLQQRC